MRNLSRNRQRGLSLVLMLLLGVVIILLAVLAARLVPPVTEYLAIERTIHRIKGEASTVPEIRKAFERQAIIDDIRSIRAGDLDITKEGDAIVISYAYSYSVPIIDRVRLVIDFAGSTSSRPERTR